MFTIINFYHYSFIVFLIASLSFVISNIFNKTIAETLSTSVLFIIFFLYWFALLNALQLGFYILIVAIFILTLTYLILKRKNLKRLVSLGSVSYVVLIFIIAYIFKNYFIYTWDDLSHWGLTAKDMYFKSSIVKRDYNDYPIGTRVFQYFILKVYGGYNEAVLLTYFYMIYFSFVVYPLKNIKLKSLNNVLIVLLYLVLALILPTCFIVFDNLEPFKIYRFLMVDLLLGLTFGFTTYIVFIKRYFTKYDSLQLFLLLFFLVQIKIVGLMFAVTVLLWIIIREKNIFSGLKEGVFFLIPILLSKLSWLFYINYYSYSSYLSDRFHSAKNIINFNDFFSTYINALSYRPVFLFFSTVDLLLLFFTISLFFIAFYKYLRLYIIKLFLLLFVLFLVYNIGLYFTYMNVFHDVEKNGLFSFERYQNILFSGLIFILFLLLPKLFLIVKNHYNTCFLALLLLFLFGYSVLFTYTKYNKDINIPIYAKKLNKDVDALINVLPKNLESKKIVMISDDFYRLVLRYKTGYNVYTYKLKENPDLIIIYNKEKYKEKIINYLNLHKIQRPFKNIKRNIIYP